MRMQYQEYEIAETLRPYVKVIWSMESDSSVFGGTPIHILPDTCVELVIHFGDPYKTTFSDNSVSIQEQSFVVAQMKSFMKIQSHGKTGLIAVRFSALGAYHFFGIPMKEIVNGETGLRNVWHGLASEIEEKIYDAANIKQRAQIIQRYLLLQLSRNGYTDKGIEFCVNEIKQAKGQISVDVLANKVGISNRQLVRRFDKCIGLSPKEFIRITKFISSLDMMNYSKDKNLTEIALVSGYYDQAHFIRDFREFSGMTPTDYQASSNVVY
jgi:AraC-like DNA-binding protein